MNMGLTIFIVIAGLWAIAIFFGAIGKLAKPFMQTPTSAIDSSSLEAQERQRAQDTEQQRQQVMDDMRQRMQDAKRY